MAFPLLLLGLGWALLARPGALSQEPSGSLLTRGGPVTFVGDSLTAQGDWQAAFPGHQVHNRGVSGDTTFQLMARLPAVRQTGASTYLVMVGINDIGWGYSPRGIASRIQWLRSGLQLGGGARVIVQSTIPCARFRCGPEGLHRVAELNQRLAQQIPPQDFVDLTPVMADADGLKHAYTVDGVHLNAAGYARWQSRLRELGLP
ncbi:MULTISPECIES: GDSL-type esterase/lipase family protein [unclassified Cyanobium]|uniref:GDSL-type esterase/lipase family protein n=1 Tax=unclassified Cyanobium TaxID=2627006 RepID=UPI0020CF5EAB|nr:MULTISPECIES: GDSL-type esterase/lipase family protein [unclassified Cyanobium]